MSSMLLIRWRCRGGVAFPARDYRTASSTRGDNVGGCKPGRRERDQGTRERAANRAILSTTT